MQQTLSVQQTLSFEWGNALPFAGHRSNTFQTVACKESIMVIPTKIVHAPLWYTAYAVVLTKYCLNHCTRTCCSLRIVTRCRFMNWSIRCERGGRNVLFLSINLISCRRSRDIVLVMASSAREMDSAGRQWNIEKDLRNVRDFSVRRLPGGSTISVWLNKHDTLLCVPTGTRNSACFEVGLIRTVIDHVTVSERAA